MTDANMPRCLQRGALFDLASISLNKTVDPETAICGGLFNYTYVVNNTGDVSLTSINLTDNVLGNITLNGTNTASPPANGIYISGDLDGDNILDPDESWIFEVQNHYLSSSVTNTGNATGIDIVSGDLLWDTDDAHMDITYLSISGTKFEELNGNGTRDLGDPGLENWTIVLSFENGTFRTTNTTSDGSYQFDFVCPGNYTMSEVLKDGWLQTYPNTGDGNYIINVTNANLTGYDFGNYYTACLGGNKTNDTGVGLAGWNITVFENGTLNEVNTTQTDSNGYWQVCGLLPSGLGIHRGVDQAQRAR